MESLSAALLIKSLDGLAARQAVTAQNIANAGTPGYRPLRVTFENALAQAASRGANAVREVEPAIVLSGATDLRLDLELATASTTSMRYAALIEVLGRRLQLDGLAVTGSR